MKHPQTADQKAPSCLARGRRGSNQYDRVFSDIVFAARTIEEVVKDRSNKRTLTRTQLKLFYTVLKRTKGYIEAAQSQLQEKRMSYTIR